MPGIPSIYYGSEWGITGRRTRSDDSALRPCPDLASMSSSAPQPALPAVLRRLAELRASSPVLRGGGYTQLLVSHDQFAFLREKDNGHVVVALNAAAEPAAMTIPLPCQAVRAVDLLNGGETFAVQEGKLHLPEVPAHWARVMRLRTN